MLPRSTVDRNQGGGQRTAIIFDALRELAPTTVVVLGDIPLTDVRAAFPGAESVLVWPEFDMSEEATGKAERVIAFASKYAFPAAFYRPVPQLEAKLAVLASVPGTTLTVFRLFRTLAAANATAQPDKGRFVVVDVDDRDDQKADARLRALFGEPLVDAVLRRWSIEPLTRLFFDRLRRTSSAWFVTQEDAAIAGHHTVVIENAPYARPTPDELVPPSAGRDMLFVGPAHFPPNANGMRWFLKECWPSVRSRSPDARLKIVGGGDWHAIASGADGVDVRGFVPDVAAEYLACRAAICPLDEGGGSKVKLIEACAYGRPVIATSHSLRGFSDALTSNIWRADSARAFADACLQLIENPAEADRRGSLLREVQVRLYSRDAVKAKIGDALRALLVRDRSATQDPERA